MNKLKFIKMQNKHGKILRQAIGKTELKMSLIDKGYYTIQEILSSKNGKTVKSLAEAAPRQSSNIREELRDEALTEKTNQVAQEYAKQPYVDIRQNEEERE